MPKYSVCSPIKHDGKKYAVGAPITLSAKVADQLVADGVLDDSEDRAVQEQADADAQRQETERLEQERIAAEQAEADRRAHVNDAGVQNKPAKD